MIAHDQFLVAPLEGQTISSALAYPLYSWLLEQLPEELGEQLHRQDALTPSQCLWFDRETGQYRWQLTLPSETLISALHLVLEEPRTITLHTGDFRLTPQKSVRYENALALLSAVRNAPVQSQRTALRFLTTTTFKQDGRYVLFPQVRLILQSLIRKWNQLCPDYLLTDEDAFQLLLQGLHITDYQLRSSRYPLKGNKITGFTGTIIITSHLSPPMEELWQLLLRIAPLTGIGIKTALGMGGTAVCIPRQGREAAS